LPVSRRSPGIGHWFSEHAAGLAIGACALSIALGGVLIFLLAGLDEVPAWWKHADTIRAGDAEVIARAERLENALTTQLTAVREPGDPRWATAIGDEQANAWLAVRLRETITTHLGVDKMPEAIERVRVGIEDDELIIGARINHASGSSIVWSRVHLELDEQRDLWATLSSLHVGDTPIPQWVLAAMDTRRITGSRRRLGPGALDLGDGREARILALRVKDGRLEAMMETREPPAQ